MKGGEPIFKRGWPEILQVFGKEGSPPEIKRRILRLEAKRASSG